MTPFSSLRCAQLSRGLYSFSGSPSLVGGDGHSAADHPGAGGTKTPTPRAAAPATPPTPASPPLCPAGLPGTILGGTLGLQPLGGPHPACSGTAPGTVRIVLVNS